MRAARRRVRAAWGRARSEAGFSMMEAIVAIVILAAIGFTVHRAALSALRHMQAGKERASQAKLLEYAVDWVRAEACLFAATVSPGSAFDLTLFDGSTATVRRLAGRPGDPPALRTVEIELPPANHAPGATQTVVLDVGVCP